jgi:NAD-dependent deacetylase
MNAADIITEVRQWVDQSTRVVVLTGAGISTESGIPDFRGPQGVWTKDPKAEKLSNIHYYMADPDVRRLAWQGRLEHPAWTAIPNAGHRALVELERRGKLHALVTQNIDGLHQRAGNSADCVVEVHGTVHDVVCMQCSWRGPMKDALDRVQAGDADPACLECGGILKSATISFARARGHRSGDAGCDQGRPLHRRWHQPAGLSGGRNGAACQQRGSANRHRQRPTDAVR